MQLASYRKSEAYRKREVTKDNPTCKRAISGSFLQDQSPPKGENSCGEEEEEGRQQQESAEQSQRHPATAPACSQPWHKDPVRVAPDWQGTAALPERLCRTVLCPTEEKQKAIAVEVLWKSFAPHKFYFLLHFTFPDPIHITTCSHKHGSSNRQSLGPNLARCVPSNVSIAPTAPPTQPCDPSQEYPDPSSPTGVGMSHSCHITPVAVIPNKGTCCKLPSSCLVLAGLC